MKNENKISAKDEQEIFVTKRRSSYSVPTGSWIRIKNKVRSLVAAKRGGIDRISIAWGVLFSQIASLVALLSQQGVRVEVWFVSWVILIGALMAIIFGKENGGLKHELAKKDLESVLEEMAAVEESLGLEQESPLLPIAFFDEADLIPDDHVQGVRRDIQVVSVAPEEEELIREAYALFLTHGRASTSMLQTYMRVGYNKAKRIITAMEERGMIGPPTNVGFRDVYKSFGK